MMMKMVLYILLCICGVLCHGSYCARSLVTENSTTVRCVFQHATQFVHVLLLWIGGQKASYVLS